MLVVCNKALEGQTSKQSVIYKDFEGRVAWPSQPHQSNGSLQIGDGSDLLSFFGSADLVM